MGFDKKIYSILKKVPAGMVTTYKELAHALNCKAYRAVGNALNKNPHAPVVPCHRVVKSSGFVGGFAHGNLKKIKLLKKEGVMVKDGRVVGFEKIIFRF